jgi:hypothetical protein
MRYSQAPSRSVGSTWGDMNYFAHGRDLIGQPCRLAGASLPDWLNVVDRRVRVRRRQALLFVDDSNPLTRELARGVVQHHDDDQWFHATAAFAQSCAELTVMVREAIPGDSTVRVGFLGHILVEMLLDASLIEAHPERLNRYYETMAQVDPEQIRSCAEQLAGRPIPGLPRWIVRFRELQFLRDYACDSRLVLRLNQIMHRVGLVELPAGVTNMLPAARQLVRNRVADLLSPTIDPVPPCEENSVCNLA